MFGFDLGLSLSPSLPALGVLFISLNTSPTDTGLRPQQAVFAILASRVALDEPSKPLRAFFALARSRG